MNWLIAEALSRLADIEARGLGDAPFIVPMADNARMADIDVSIHHGTAQPRKLVRNDGTIEDRFLVESVRVANLTPDRARGFGATMFLTVKSFLSVRAVRSTDSMDGIDWCSSNNSTNCNLQQARCSSTWRRVPTRTTTSSMARRTGARRAPRARRRLGNTRTRPRTYSISCRAGWTPGSDRNDGDSGAPH